MRILALLLFINLFASIAFGQASDNYRNCRELIRSESLNAEKSVFHSETELNENEINLLKDLLFVKKRVYNVQVNLKGTEISIYHLSDLHFEDLKILMEPSSIPLKYINTTLVKFDELLNTKPINKK